MVDLRAGLVVASGLLALGCVGAQVRVSPEVEGGVRETLDQLAALAIERGPALEAADVRPFLDPEVLASSDDLEAYSFGLASFFRSLTATSSRTFTLAATGLAPLGEQVVGGSWRLSTGPYWLIDVPMQFRRAPDGRWRIYGDGRIGFVRLFTTFRESADASGGVSSSLKLLVGYGGPRGRVRSVEVSGPGLPPLSFVPGGAHYRAAMEHGLAYDEWSVELDASEVIAGGTYVFRVQPAEEGAGALEYRQTLPAVLREPIRLVSPTTHALGDLAGRPLTVRWTPPATLELGQVQVCWATRGSEQCTAPSAATSDHEATLLTPTSTAAATLRILLRDRQGYEGAATELRHTFEP